MNGIGKSLPAFAGAGICALHLSIRVPGED